MAQLYRKTAVERLYSPDRLDSALKVTSPMSWLALIAVTLIIAVTVVWGFLGRIPVTISAPGIVCSPVSTNAIYASEAGTVEVVLVHEGQRVTYYTPIIDYRTGNGEKHTIYSNQVGTVTKILVSDEQPGPGEEDKREILPGNELLRLSPEAHSRQVVVCYVRLTDAKKIRPDMKVNILLSSAESQTYGHMAARVINVDSDASTVSGMAQVTGSDNFLAESLRQDGSAVVAVTCELYPGDTVSGYWWSNSRGAKQEVADRSVVEARIIIEEIAPINKLFAKLNEVTEG